MATLKTHEELDAWQLADDLKERVLTIMERPRFARDLGLCDDLRRAIRSAPANLAEGFWRHLPKDRARFVSIAIGSLGETQNHLLDAHNRQYIDAAEHATLRDLAIRARKAAVGWHNYLKSCEAKENPKPNRKPNRKPPTETQTE